MNDMKNSNATKFQRLTFDQYQNWKRALRLNRCDTFADLRSLYLSVRGGAQYGLYSGYAA